MNPSLSPTPARRRPTWRSLLAAAALLWGATLTTGCAHVHRVGVGPSGVAQESQRQFYVLFGLYRLNDADVTEMSAGLTGYEVKTSFTFTDFLLFPFLLPLSAGSRTVTVTR